MVNARPWFLTNSETVSSPPNRDPGNGNGGPPPAGWTGRGRGGGWGKGGKKGAGGNGFDGVQDIAIVRLAAPTHGTPTTQDFTVAGLGTPKAAIFLTGWVGTDDTAENHMSASFGATDGTNQWFAHTSSQNNAGPGASTRKRVGDNDGVGALTVGAAGGIDAKIAFNSWITDGVRVDWTYPSSTDTEGKFVTCILFGGSAVSASAGIATLATQNNSATLTPGFETHVGFFATPATTMAGTEANAAVYVPGFLSNDGVTIRQASAAWVEANAADPTDVTHVINTNGVGTRANPASYVKAENITATQIDLTSIGSSFTDWDNMGYLLLNIGSGEAWAGVLDSPTATGVKSFEEPGIEPIFGTIYFTMLQSTGTGVGTTDAQSFGYGAFTENEEFSNAYSAEDAKTVSTNTKSWASQKAASFTNDGSAAAFAGTLDSFDADGANINFTTADGTVRKWPALFIGRG